MNKNYVLAQDTKNYLVHGLTEYYETQGENSVNGICSGVKQAICDYATDNDIYLSYATSRVFYSLFEYFNIQGLSNTKNGFQPGFNYVREGVTLMLIDFFKRSDVELYTHETNHCQFGIRCTTPEAATKAFEIRQFVYENACDEFGSIGKPKTPRRNYILCR